MQNDTALLFQFTDTDAAALASDTLQELGYEPVIQQGQDVHIHLHGSDLTSALEIALAYGGQLAVQSPINDGMVMEAAYDMDAIPIPAHVVNEDWISQEERAMQLVNSSPAADGAAAIMDTGIRRNRDDDAPGEETFFPDEGTYDHFSGDVHT